MTLSIEVLPAPFGPMMARISPLRMSKETSEIALTPPNESETFSQRKQDSPAARCLAHAARLRVGGGWIAMSTIAARADELALAAVLIGDLGRDRGLAAPS